MDDYESIRNETAGWLKDTQRRTHVLSCLDTIEKNWVTNSLKYDVIEAMLLENYYSFVVLRRTRQVSAISVARVIARGGGLLPFVPFLVSR